MRVNLKFLNACKYRDFFIKVRIVQVYLHTAEIKFVLLWEFQMDQQHTMIFFIFLQGNQKWIDSVFLLLLISLKSNKNNFMLRSIIKSMSFSLSLVLSCLLSLPIKIEFISLRLIYLFVFYFGVCWYRNADILLYSFLNSNCSNTCWRSFQIVC